MNLDLYVLGDDASMSGIFPANQMSLCPDPHQNYGWVEAVKHV